MPPGVITPPQRAIRPAIRRPGLLAGSWAARSLTGPPLAALAAIPWVTGQTALDHRQATVACLAAGGATTIANARRAGSKRRTAARMRAWHASRGELGDRYDLDDLPDSQEGVWRLGPMTDPGPRGDFELQYRPFDGDPPHFLGVASTGGGKSELAKGPILGYPLKWNEDRRRRGLEPLFEVDVIDLKGSSEFWPLRVHSTPGEAAALLTDLRRDLDRRAVLLRDVRRDVVAPDGEVIEGRNRTFREIPEEDRAGLRIRVVLIDEASLLNQPRPAGSADPKQPGPEWQAYRAGQSAIANLRAITALGRSLGVHIFILIQRPDADLLPGFLKNNVQARVLLGENDLEAQQMTLGDARASDAIIESDPTKRPPGRLVAAAVGGPGARLAQAYLIHEAAFLRRAHDAGGQSSPPPPASATAGPPSRPARSGPAPSSARPVRPAADRGYLPIGLSGGTRDYVPSPPPAPGSSAPAASGRPSHASSARAVRGLVVRAVLRAAAWRLLVGPHVLSPPERVSGLRDAVLSRHRHRCAACGDAGGPLQVDHWRPRWAGGTDRMRNLWVMCVRCHAAKTREEAIVRKWRRRLSLRVLARVPAGAWGLAASFALGCYAAGAMGAWVVLHVLALFGVWQMLALMWRRTGLDGRNTLDARLEESYGGSVAFASRTVTGVMLGVSVTRLYAGALSVTWLCGAMLRWWW